MQAAHDVSAFILRHRHIAPQRVAIDLGGSTLTYAELGAVVDSMAMRLQQAGLVSGDLVMLTADSELILLVSMLGISAAGGESMVLRRSMPQSAVDDQWIRFKPKFLVTDHNRFNIPTARTVFVRPDELRHIDTSGDVTPPLRVTHSSPDRSPIFCLVIGSGSTGQAKFLAVTPQQEISHLNTRVKALGFTAHDQVGSFTHVEFTSARRHIFSALGAGSTVKLFPKNHDSSIPTLVQSNVSVLHVSVILLHELVRKSGGQKGLFPNLRSLVTGGSMISEELRHSTDQHLTKYLHVVYGTNELGFLTVAPPGDWRTHPGSIGRPIEGVEIEIVDAHGMPVADGQPGLLRFRKPEMMTEYLDAPDLTRRSFRDGWFYPHDVGSMGADGIVRFIGRADDMMIFNGINVYPLEIERSMRELAGIKDVAALPLRHPVHQDVPVCAVVLQEGSVLDKAQILAWGRSVLGTVAPKHVFIVDQIPRDDSGKLLRPLLRKKISDMLDTAGSQSGQPQGDAS